MISVETGDYSSSGIADLEEAVALAKRQGISNAVDAVDPTIIWDMFSLGTMIGMGMSQEVPGVMKNGASFGGVRVEGLKVAETVSPLARLLTATETEIIRVAGEDLPNWQPTKSYTGARIISMFREAVFLEHSDDYEGLVASIQFMVDGEKIMNAKVNGEWEQVPVKQGDITFFAGDTFSEHSRALHGFDFTGAFAVAFTLGQDPYYTISGNRPIIEENPQYLL